MAARDGGLPQQAAGLQARLLGLDRALDEHDNGRQRLAHAVRLGGGCVVPGARRRVGSVNAPGSQQQLQRQPSEPLRTRTAHTDGASCKHALRSTKAATAHGKEHGRATLDAALCRQARPPPPAASFCSVLAAPAPA